MLPPSQKPTIVFVRGAWHSPSAYDKFRAALNTLGFEVHIPQLLTVNGSRPPNADLYTDSDLIRNYVTSLVDAGRQVLMLMHSYGGQVGTNALAGLGVERRQQDGLPGGVTRLVYLSGFALKEDTGMMDVVERFGHLDLIPLAFDIADDYSSVNRDPRTLHLGPGLSEEVYLGHLRRWNAKGMYQASREAAWREIPVSYIQTTADMTVLIEYQKWIVGEMEAEGKEVQTFELATGHCCMMTMMNETVGIVEEIVKRDQVGQKESALGA